MLAALRRQPNPVTVWEYPGVVLAALAVGGIRAKHSTHYNPKHILERIHFWLVLGRAPFWTSNIRVDIADVLQQKRAAIGQHTSQTEKLIDDPGWVTLEELSNGEWMDCFYQDREFFRCYTYGAE